MRTDDDGSASELRDRIAQLRAALRDTPPHSGSGARHAIEEELARLERLLARRR